MGSQMNRAAPGWPSSFCPTDRWVKQQAAAYGASVPVEQRLFATHFFVSQPSGVQMALLSDLGPDLSWGPRSGHARIQVKVGSMLGDYEVTDIDPVAQYVEIAGPGGWVLLSHRLESDLFLDHARATSRRQTPQQRVQASLDSIEADCNGSGDYRTLMRMDLEGEGLLDYYSFFALDMTDWQRRAYIKRRLGGSCQVEFIPAGEMGYGEGWTLFQVYCGGAPVEVSDSPDTYGTDPGWQDNGRPPGVQFSYEFGPHRFSYAGDSLSLLAVLGFAAYSARTATPR